MKQVIQKNEISIIPIRQLQEVIHSLFLGFDRNRYGHSEIYSLNEKEIYEEITDIVLRVIFVLLLEDRNFCNKKFHNGSSIGSILNF